MICKYVKIDPNDIKLNLERQDNLEVLEVKIELPDAQKVWKKILDVSVRMRENQKKKAKDD